MHREKKREFDGGEEVQLPFERIMNFWLDGGKPAKTPRE